MNRKGWLRVALAVGGLLALFWGVTMLFLPETGHDMMASGQPYDRATTQMFGGAVLATVIAAIMAPRNPVGEYKELVHFLPFIWGIIFVVALLFYRGGGYGPHRRHLEQPGSGRTGSRCSLSSPPLAARGMGTVALP